MMSRYHQRRGVFKIGGVFIYLFFFWSGCACGLWAFGSLRLLGYLGFLVSRFLGFLAPFLGFLELGLSTSCNLVAWSTIIAFCSCMTSWFPWLLGFSVSGLLGLSTSCNLVAWSIIIAFCSCMVSWFPWLLGFSVSGLLGHLTSCSVLVLYGLLASWFPWLFGLSACWPLDFL